ncbi:class 1 fructose-bisphosphatase [Candidatus Levibacter sp. Uisw_134_01]|uniref:class 1 fructose-bisphosphatase n=1 Tax=Candidatus Levibacter sp. Uisw_134_01 TaxID=3230999 RepID=UPI003D43A366
MLLKEYLTDNCENEQLAIIINNLADAAILISKTIKTINKISQSEVNKKSINVDGDLQKPLDIKSDEIIIDYLKKSPVAGYASEEQEGFIDFKNNNEFIVFADPLDGSSNIDVNVSIGTIFSIMPKNNLLLDKAFTQSGAKQKSSGFFVYGPQTTFFLTLGKGTLLFALDENIEMFVIINDEVSIPKSTSEFAINAAYKRYWNSPTAKYIQDCQDGEEGSRKKNFGMRWVGSLVADASRILIRGGVFLYPSDARTKYKNGRLRLTYEANPIAFLIEQAGGKAINGIDDILTVPVKNIHQRSPLVFGSSDEVIIYRKHCENL